MKDFVKLLYRPLPPGHATVSNATSNWDWSVQTGQCQLISPESGPRSIKNSAFLCNSINANEYFENSIKFQ